MREALLLRAPANAAAGAGIPVRSTSSSRSEFAMEPISDGCCQPSGAGLLNMIENPNTPKKLIISLRIRCSTGVRFRSSKSIGCSRRSSAIIHANIVATMNYLFICIGKAFKTGAQIQLCQVDSACDKRKSGYDKEHGTDVSGFVN